MPNPAINVTTTTEVGYCPFCGRSRNLRREERHLGGLVRTTIDCESCHRTLSSTIGPPAPKAEREPEPKPETAKVKTAAARRKPAAKAKTAAVKKPTAGKKPASTTKKAAAKKK